MTAREGSPRQRTGLTKHQTRGTLVSLNWNLALRTIFGTISSSGSFVFVAFALSLGLQKEQMGWIATMVSFASLAQMAGLIVSSRARNKKRMLVHLSLGEPLVLILAIAVIPFLPHSWKLYGLAIAVFASAALINLTRPLADDWTASAIPAGLRENFLGRRSQLLSFIAIGATLATGYMAEWIRGSSQANLAWLLIAGALFGVWAALPLRRGVLPSVTARASVTWEELKEVPRNRPFRRYLLVICLISLPFFLASPFYQVVHLEVLKLSTPTIAYMTVGYYVVKSLMSRYCATLVVRWGADLMLSIACVIYTVFFLSYVLAYKGHAWPVFAAWVLLGLADAIFNIAQGTALFAVIPHTPARSAYFATFSLIVLAFYGIGGLLAMPFLEAFKGKRIAFAGLMLNNFQCLFLLAVVLMIISTVLVRIIHIREPRRTQST